MILKEGVSLAGLHPVMRAVLRAAEGLWKAHGRREGVTVTEALGGVHSAESWHYYGLALDFRTRYFDFQEAEQITRELRDALPQYDVVHHTKQAGPKTVTSHIHIEVGNLLAAKIGVLY